MAVKIRLSRIGKKHVPFYRLVDVDGRCKRDGAFLENLGTYDGLISKIINFREDRYTDWIAKGAIPTDSVLKIYKLHKKTGQSGMIQKAVLKPEMQKVTEEKPKTDISDSPSQEPVS